MAIFQQGPRAANPNPETKEEKFDNLFLYQEQMIRQEVDRGNYLCQIIIKQSRGLPLDEGEQETVDRIMRNTAGVQETTTIRSDGVVISTTHRTIKGEL